MLVGTNIISKQDTPLSQCHRPALSCLAKMRGKFTWTTGDINEHRLFFLSGRLFCQLMVQSLYIMADLHRTTGAEESAVGIAPSPSSNNMEPTSSAGHDVAINHGPILEAEAEDSNVRKIMESIRVKSLTLLHS